MITVTHKIGMKWGVVTGNAGVKDNAYSRLFLWVKIFVKSWKRASELNFVVLNFVAR